jgi:hypothetical protein
VRWISAGGNGHSVTSASRSWISASSCFDLGVDLGEGSGWDVLVEVAGEGDLVAELGLVVVDPGVGHVGVDLGFDVVVDGAAVLDGPSRAVTSAS